jgi:hypothetical protein
MIRGIRLAVGFVLISSIMGSAAHAQYWGYGGWGWGGWGATPQGDFARGAAAYAMGAGIYNYDTAVATSINADTAMRVNQYVFEATMEEARRHAARLNADVAKNKALYAAHEKQIQDNPTPQQIENGDALNAAVAQLSDPRLGSSAVRAASAPVDAKIIAEVPFQNASERVTIMLDELKKALNWPAVFEEPRFSEDKKAFDDVVARARKEDEEGDISPKTIQEAKNLINDLRAKLEAQPLKDPEDNREALRFVKSFTILVGLLDKPDIRQALSELRKVKNTTIGHLLGFMHAFNLRFGPATTLREKQAYQQLYAILDQTRDQILAEAKLDNTATARANPSHLSDFFQNMDESRLRQRTPQPPPPRNPE